MRGVCPDQRRPSSAPDPESIPPDPSPSPPPQPPLPDLQPSPSNPPTSPPIPQLSVVLLLAIWLSILGTSATALAQTIPSALPTPPPTQPPFAAISPIQPLSAPTSGLPATILTPSTTDRLEPNPGLRSSSAPAFNSAGRGLPGMPSGPPLNDPPGARDPSAQFMRPPTVGPLFCDPAINIPC